MILLSSSQEEERKEKKSPNTSYRASGGERNNATNGMDLGYRFSSFLLLIKGLF